MTPAFAMKYIVGPALSLLPKYMDTPEARAMMIAIALQESRLEYRHQIRGPAHGYWQFEKAGGVRGVIHHASSARFISRLALQLGYGVDENDLYTAIEHNDLLACCFARLLLYTLPATLPGRDERQKGWDQYIAAWRPGKPHRATWDSFWVDAWAAVDQYEEQV